MDKKTTNYGITLPIYKHRAEIIHSLTKNSLTIISGDTGCGKTTQLPKFLLEERLQGKRQIAVTQPRRISAISVAQRVSFELSSELGQTVGFEVRFESCLSESTVVKFMTEGILIREFTLDNSLSRYSIIIIDEAHERGINCDFLLGLAHSLLKSRRDLKLVIMSATLETEKIVKFFTQGIKGLSHRVIQVEGRFHPIEVMNTKEPMRDYIEAAYNTILQIHFSEKQGDILVFLTGQAS